MKQEETRFLQLAIKRCDRAKIKENNENHHLWNNRGDWWCAITIHEPDATSNRFRFPLKTKKVETARHRRDEIFEMLKKEAEVVYC